MSAGFKGALILLSVGAGMLGFVISGLITVGITIALIVAGLLLGVWTLDQHLGA